MPPRTVVVTGAAGSVAGQLLPGLRGPYDLRLVDRVRSEDDGATVLIGELTDPATVDRALAGADAVVHLAGNPEPDAPWEELREPNVEGFVTLLAAARRHAVRRVVFASSVHAMGGYEGSRRWPVDPSWPPSPCCAYGATKAFDEALARAFAYRSELSLVGLRFGFCSPDVTPRRLWRAGSRRGTCNDWSWERSKPTCRSACTTGCPGRAVGAGTSAAP